MCSSGCTWACIPPGSLSRDPFGTAPDITLEISALDSCLPGGLLTSSRYFHFRQKLKVDAPRRIAHTHKLQILSLSDKSSRCMPQRRIQRHAGCHSMVFQSLPINGLLISLYTKAQDSCFRGGLRTLKWGLSCWVSSNGVPIPAQKRIVNFALDKRSRFMPPRRIAHAQVFRSRHSRRIQRHAGCHSMGFQSLPKKGLLIRTKQKLKIHAEDDCARSSFPLQTLAQDCCSNC